MGTTVYMLAGVWLFVPIVRMYMALKGYNGVGNMPDLSFVKTMYANPLLDFKALADKRILTGYLIMSFIVAVITAALIVIARESGVNTAGVEYLKDNGTHGTANWMTESEARKVLGIGTNRGLIFGKINGRTVTLHEKTYFNRNVAVFGASGSMKSRSYVRTNMLQLAKEGKSMVVTDPKGELFNDMARFLRDMGYDVKLFNLVNMTHSDRWNPIAEVKDDIDAQMFTEVVIANTKVIGSKSGDPFWDRAEQNLLKALVLYVVCEYPEENKNLASVYALLASGDSKKVDDIFDTLPAGHPAKMPYNIYAQANETVRTGVVIGLGTRLQVFQNRLVQKLTEVSDIDLTQPARKKCAYFCISSDMDSTFDFLAGLFFSFLFIKLIRYADMNGGRCSPEVYFLLDEFPNIGAIPDFTKKISTIRSRGLHCSVIFQNIAQLRNRYPNDAWQEIIGNCDSRLFLGCTDTATAQFVCDLLGAATVRSVSIRKKAGLEGLFDLGDVSSGTQKRNLLNPDEILRLPPEKAILILRGQKPLMIDKMDYTKHPLAKMIKPEPISMYSPEWAKEEKQNKANVKQVESEKEADMEQTQSAKETDMKHTQDAEEKETDTAENETKFFYISKVKTNESGTEKTEAKESEMKGAENNTVTEVSMNADEQAEKKSQKKNGRKSKKNMNKGW